MPARKKDTQVTALQAVHAALKPLKPEDRSRVLASVRALLEFVAEPREITATPVIGQSRPSPEPTARPISLVELVHEKKPTTNPQRIALFAYYREKYEGHAHFGRDDLLPYFVKARISPPKNYDRDFVEALKRGWLHEEGTESYVTSKGIEAVEAGFSGELPPRGRAARRKTPGKRRKAKTTRKRS